jgi:GNAT superfamily N-acetyltransferase
MLLALDVADADEICLVVNDAAAAYRGVIPADCWKEPYMPLEEVHEEIDAGVVFWGDRRGGRLAGVMGLQQVQDVALIRHAYTRTSEQGAGVGSALLEHLRRHIDRPLLVGTWKAATWAVRFYERRGFRLVSDEEKARLLRRYWSVPERQIAESVALQTLPRPAREIRRAGALDQHLGAARVRRHAALGRHRSSG